MYKKRPINGNTEDQTKTMSREHQTSMKYAPVKFDLPRGFKM